MDVDNKRVQFLANRSSARRRSALTNAPLGLRSGSTISASPSGGIERGQ